MNAKPLFWSLAGALALSGCAALQRLDNRLSGAATDNPARKETPAAPAAQKPQTEKEIWDFLAGKDDAAEFNADKVFAVVNGVAITDRPGGALSEVAAARDETLEIKVFNAGKVSLMNVEIGFHAPGAQFDGLGLWTVAGDTAWYWCRAPINPSDPRAEPFSYFTTANSFKLSLPSGKNAVTAQIRIKSLNRPEIVRSFLLKPK